MSMPTVTLFAAPNHATQLRMVYSDQLQPANDSAQGYVPTSRAQSAAAPHAPRRVLCVGERSFGENVGRALGADYPLLISSVVGEAVSVFETSSVAVAIVGFSGQGHAEQLKVIGRLKTSPHAPAIVSYFWLRPGAGGIVAAALNSGSDVIAFHGYDNVRCVIDLAIQLSHARVPCLLMKMIHEVLDPPAMDIADCLMSHANHWPSITHAARLLGCSARTLERRFSEAGLPPITRLYARLRCLWIAHNLAMGPLSLSELAATSGYPSAEALRLFLRRQGTCTHRLGHVGAVAEQLEMLRREYGGHAPPTDRRAAVDPTQQTEGQMKRRRGSDATVATHE